MELAKNLEFFCDCVFLLVLNLEDIKPLRNTKKDNAYLITNDRIDTEPISVFSLKKDICSLFSC